MLGLETLKTRIEIPVFCVLFGFCVQASIGTNLVIYRTCYINLGYNESECVLLGTGHDDNFTQQLEKIVEPDANTINLYLTLPVGLICAFVSLFIGSWSDRNGRKPVLIASIAGQAISYMLAIIYCLLPGLSPWYLLLTSPPVIVTGGFSVMLTTFLSYITDVSNEDKRGMRLGMFEATFSLASLLGTFSSSYIFKVVGYVGIYSVSTGFTIVALLYIIFILDESLLSSHIEVRSQEVQPPFVEQLRTMTKSAFRRRPHFERSLIVLSVIITSIFIFAFMADMGIVYLFLRLKFAWSLKKFTIFSSLRDSLSIVGTFLGVYGLHKKLNVNEAVVVLMGLLSCFSSSLVQGLATIDAHIYFAGALRFLSGAVNPMIRSLISKIAKPDEVGQIFAVAVMCQSSLQLLGNPLYTEIYNKSLSTWPSLYNYVTAGIYLTGAILTIVVIILHNKTPTDVTFRVLDEESIVSPGSINDDEQEVIS